jgi:hypothetical protein
MIKWDKPLQTQHGNSVRYIGEIISHNEFTHAVAVSYVKDAIRWEFVFIVNNDGISNQGPDGIKVVVKNLTKSGWVAVKRDVPSGRMYVAVAIYETKEECEKNNAGFVDCVKIEWVE